MRDEVRWPTRLEKTNKSWMKRFIGLSCSVKRRLLLAVRLEPLERETNELIAIFVSMAKGVKQKKAGDHDGKVIPHPSALIT